MTPAKNCAQRLQKIREQRGWSQQELADRLTFYGWTGHRTTIAKIEAGDRQVTVDDLVSIAFALGVSPAALLFPSDDASTVQFTPNTTGPAGAAWSWVSGQMHVASWPIFGHEPEPRRKRTDPFEDARIYNETGPASALRAEQRLPGLRHLIGKLLRARDAAGATDEALAETWPNLEQLLDDAAEDLAFLARQAHRGVPAD